LIAPAEAYFSNLRLKYKLIYQKQKTRNSRNRVTVISQQPPGQLSVIMHRVKQHGTSTVTRNQGGNLSATTPKKKKSEKKLLAAAKEMEEGKQTAAVGY